MATSMCLDKHLACAGASSHSRLRQYLPQFAQCHGIDLSSKTTMTALRHVVMPDKLSRLFASLIAAILRRQMDGKQL